MMALFRYYIPAPAIDGIFGTRTREAVVAYQRQKGLAPDGIVGQQTWNSLLSVYLGLAHTTLSYAGLPVEREEIEAAYLAGQFPGVPLSYGNQDARGAS